MKTLLVDLTNVDIDEVTSLKERLEEECWKSTEISVDETNGLLQIINYIIDKRINHKATDLSYTDLINLKNKLRYY